jgi:lysophospholipase L1-like esterase
VGSGGGAAHVALADAGGKPVPGTDREVKFAGQPSVLIAAGAPELSDPVDLPTQALASVSISIFLPQDTGPCTCHAVGMQSAYVSDKGDFSAHDFTPAQTLQSRAFLSGVEVDVGGAAKTIVALGDSITDGVGSTPNTNRRWPDVLAERLAGRRSSGAWGVVNVGISGNRILNDGAGQSALARLDRDVLSVPGAAYVIVFEGVNDLGISYGRFEGPMAERFRSLMPPEKATAESMIAGYRQIIERAHAKGLKVFGATIAPYEGAGYYSAEGEAVRQAINTWIRAGHAFDAVLDFDAALRDPAHPAQMATALQAGDHLHGSDAGYHAVAESIDLSLFK